MALEPETWLPKARELALGQHRKVDHVCGGGRTLRVAHEPDGYRAWCFRCNDSGWHPHPTPSLAERLARLKEKDEQERAVEADRRPPMPASFDVGEWPLEARVWLYRAGLCNDAIRRHGIYYCPKLDRVVLPVVHGDKLAYWQARGFDRDRPKYLNPPIDRTNLTADYGRQGPVVLCEDILSAIRLGEVARGWCILGTSFGDLTATRVAEAAKRDGCCLWFDPDSAGRKATAKALARLRLLGLEPRIIRSDKDPKFYSADELRRYIYTE